MQLVFKQKMTQVFDSLKICGFRGFKMMELSQLGQLNILVGTNNSGKTSFLEAIAILCNPLDPFQWLEVAQRRMYLGRLPIAFRPDLEAIKWVFPQEANLTDSEYYQGEITIEASGNTPILRMTAQLSEIYGSAEEDKLFSI